MKRHRTGKALFCAVVLALVLGVATGCATCKPKCGDTCPPIIKPVTVTKHVQVPPPLLPVPPPPTITSAIDPDLAKTDTDGWLESLLTDLAASIDAYLEARNIIETSNATRPPTE